MAIEQHTAIWAFDKEIKVFHIVYSICAVCRLNGRNDAWIDIERDEESKRGEQKWMAVIESATFKTKTSK